MFITNVHVFASKFNVQICLNYICTCRCRYVVIQLQLQHCTSHRNKLLYNICMHVNCSNMGDFRFLKQTKNNRERDWTPLPPTTYFLFGNRLILTQRKVTFLTNWPLDFFKERVQNYRENSRKDPISATKVNKTSFNFLTCWGRFALFPLSEKMLLALQKTTYVLPILIYDSFMRFKFHDNVYF